MASRAPEAARAGAGESAVAVLGSASAIGVCVGMRAPVAVLSVRSALPRCARGGAKTGSLTTSPDRLLMLGTLADAALDGASVRWRLCDHVAMPWRVAAGAFTAVAAAGSDSWPVPLLVGGAAAWLGQKAERDCRRVLTSLGLPPAVIGFAEGAIALTLPSLRCRRPALGLMTIPLAVCLVIAARAWRVRRYATLSRVRRRAPMYGWRAPSPWGVRPSCAGVRPAASFGPVPHGAKGGVEAWRKLVAARAMTGPRAKEVPRASARPRVTDPVMERPVASGPQGGRRPRARAPGDPNGDRFEVRRARTSSVAGS